jgi:hypothetical protein
MSRRTAIFLTEPGSGCFVDRVDDVDQRKTGDLWVSRFAFTALRMNGHLADFMRINPWDP